MDQRRLGPTDKNRCQEEDSPVLLRKIGTVPGGVSPIGYGAFKIGRNDGSKYAVAFELPDEQASRRLLNQVLDLGINYIDTAPAYGLSEERIGAAIGHRRREFTLSTKVGESFSGGVSTHDFSRHAIEASIRRSLERLKTDVLDFVFIHSHGDDRAILDHTDAVAVLVALRKRGLVRGIGLSGKTVEGARAALAWADAIMVEYHQRDRSHEAVISEAQAAGVGVVVKKGLASGTLEPAEAIRSVLSNPGVSTLVVGSLSAEHMRNNLSLAARVAGDCVKRAQPAGNRATAD